ncbi:cellulase [Catenulispora pinisilvae]|uniref:cellulase n=1 Tax=Catenulispora pinisilvae TaxID=2705253 RepID=UPI0018920A78|nr:cellulase [Catenulispora pinisilvae]
MDDFEQELIRMLRQPQDPRSFEPRHREQLWAAVRVRRRARVRRIAAGSVIAAAACAVGLVLLPRAVDAGPGPTGPPTNPAPTQMVPPTPTDPLPQRTSPGGSDSSVSGTTSPTTTSNSLSSGASSTSHG